MAKIGINSITNANVYIDGANLLGRVEELKLPTVKAKTQDHKGLGMMGEISIPAGGMEKMEADYTFASLYREVAGKVANPFRSALVQVRASLESYTGQGRTAEVGMIVTLGGPFTESDFATVKQHESVKPKAKQQIYYMKQVIDGETILEIDVMNNIYVTAGEDVFARFRRLIGG
jgi:P2 family phage contractile tail tube protein